MVQFPVPTPARASPSATRFAREIRSPFPRPCSCISRNFAAFQIFVVKLRPISNFSLFTFVSHSRDVMSAMENRRASAEYWSISSRGSSELPFDFDIFEPSAARTIPWMTMFLNGGLPMKWMPAIIILATQKKMMSCAVTRSVVG